MELGEFRRHALCAEAALLLVTAELAVRRLPFRHTARALGWLDRGASLAPPGRAGTQGGDRVAAVRWAILSMTRRLPVRSRCLAQALAARLMLRRRGVLPTLHLGLRRRGLRQIPGQPPRRGPIVAHAWLVVGDTPVVGGNGAGLVEIARFC